MLQIGTRVGDYEILDVLQSSRKEVLYRVRNVPADRMEALKVLPDTLQRDNDALERFFREIKLHAKLDHPNVVTFYHATELAAVVVMTTELVEGTTLATRLEAGPLPVRKAVDIAVQVLAALGHAHSHGLMHREVTPDNILLLHGDAVKLGGFGLAKLQGDVSLTQVGTTLGPVHYMSPEQIKGDAGIDFRTDLYSAGCVLYEMLSGRKPFACKSQFDTMLAHIQRDALSLAHLNKDIPALVVAAVSRAMAKEPGERFNGADAFAAALIEGVMRRPEPHAVAVHTAAARQQPQPMLRPPQAIASMPMAVQPIPVRTDWKTPLLLGATLVAALVWALTFVWK